MKTHSTGHTFNVILFLVTCSLPQTYASYLDAMLQVASSIDANGHAMLSPIACSVKRISVTEGPC